MPLGSNSACSTGRAAPHIAGHTGFLTMDEARQMAIDFAKLPKLLNGRAAELMACINRAIGLRLRCGPGGA
jgi:hypothetical protein